MTAVGEPFPADGVDLYDDLVARIDDRTRELVERRQSSGIRRRGWLIRRALLAADVAGLVSAFAVTEALLGPGNVHGHFDAAAETLVFVGTVPIWVVVAKLYGLYDRDEERTDHSTADDLSGVFHMLTVGAWIVFAGSWATGIASPDLTKLVVFWLLAIAAVGLLRATARALCRRHVSYLQNTVIVGAGEVGQLVARKFQRHPEYGINLVGFVDAEPRDRDDDLRHLPMLGTTETLLELVRMLDVERVVVAFSRESHEELLDVVRALNRLEVQVDIVPRLFEIVGAGVDVHTVGGVPLVGLRGSSLPRSSQMLKRSLDALLAAAGLVFLAPFFAVIAALIKLDSEGPVFFRQVRMGRCDRRFRIVKFRTMVCDAEEQKVGVAHLNKHARSGGDPRMFKIDDDPRVTRVGCVLRRFSLDELPQLWNVLRGEMSLVGPRPLILDEHAHIAEWRARRLDLRPGMTGLWQVLGRDDIPFKEMVRLDYIYVTSWSLRQDLRLLFQTVPAVVRDQRDS